MRAMFSKHENGVEQQQNILQVKAKIKLGSALATSPLQIWALNTCNQDLSNIL